MTTIHTVIRDRRIDFPAPSDLPDGTEIRVEISIIPGKIGLDESEWQDSPEALSDWAAWLNTIEPIPFVKDGAFEEEFRRFNIEAVRKQMFGEGQ